MNGDCEKITVSFLFGGISMKKFVYIGPVKLFDKLVSREWFGETCAETEQKAKSNLIFQYKKQTGRARTAKISLPGKLELVDEW